MLAGGSQPARGSLTEPRQAFIAAISPERGKGMWPTAALRGDTAARPHPG